MFAHDVRKKYQSQSDDVRVNINAEPQSELTPLVRSQTSQTSQISQSSKSLTSVTTDVWKMILPYLTVKDINTLRRSNGIVRRRINHALHERQFTPTVDALLLILKTSKNSYLKRNNVLKKLTILYLIEATLAEAACLLAASLPIDNFQTAYVAAYQKMARLIVDTGSVTATVVQVAPYTCYIQNVVYNFPSNCIYNCASNQITDGPAGYWFTAFFSANTAYITGRAALSIPYANYPIRKITLGLLAISLTGLTVALPVIANQGWSASAAIRTACCLASECYDGYYEGAVACDETPPGTYTDSISSYCFQTVSEVVPVSAFLAALPPLVLTGVSVGAMVAVGFWAYRKSKEFSVADEDIDSLHELDR